MSTIDPTKYRKLRKKGYSAIAAARDARPSAASSQYPFLNSFGEWSGKVTGEVEGFKVTVSADYDEHARLGDDDVTGWFTDTFEEGCIKNTRRDWGTDYKWYRPSNYDLTETFQDLRRAGMSKGQAVDAHRERIQQAMYEDANRQYYIITVTVSKAGIKLGSASLGWIDTIPGYDVAPYFQEVAEELIPDALSDARQVLADLGVPNS